MTWTIKCALAAMATCAMALASAPAWAVAIQWDIDATQSKISLAIPDQTPPSIGQKVGIRNQTGSGSSWTVGNTAFMDGTFNTNYIEGSSIDFLPGGSIFGLNSGNYRPNPAAFNAFGTNTANPDGVYANASTAPGVFGGKAVAVDILGAAVAYITFRSVNYGIDSLAPLPFSPTGGGNGTYALAGTTFGITSALLDVDGLSVILVGQLIPDMVNTSLTNLLGSVVSPTATLTNTGFENRRLTIPISIPLAIDLDGTILTANITGQIVANAVPEPSTLMMAGIGLVSLAVYARRRRMLGG